MNFDGQALKPYIEATEKGNAVALFELGLLLQSMDDSFNDAVNCFRLSAQKGYAPAQFKLGNIILDLAKGDDDARSNAMDLYLQAAQQKYAPAQLKLGLICKQLAVDHDDDEEDDYELMERSMMFIREAAEQGIADAQFSLGVMYSTGIAKDLTQVVIWVSKAAEQEHGMAKKLLIDLKNCNYY
jgi:TPR repeat protein